MTLSPDNNRCGPLDCVYVGTRDPRYGVHVVVDGCELSPAASQAIWNRSPDGFEWGYGGSGPAQLALALLLHATRGNKECALDLHQRFKWQVIARFDRDGWVLTRAGILRWIGEQPGHLEGREAAAEGGES